MMEPVDIERLERAKAGDATAMSEVLGALAPVLGRYGRAMCRNDTDAEDVLQDALLAVAQNLPSFEGRASLSSWAYMLARTACARKRRGLKNQPFTHEDDAPAAVDDRPNPEAATESLQLRSLVRSALEGLSEDYREVLVLRDVEGLTAPEAAEVLGISIDALKSRLHRARGALRDAIAPSLEGRVPAQSGATCPDPVEMLSRHLEGELDAQTCARMESHVKSCPSCGPACKSLRSALAICRASGEDVPAHVQAIVQSAMRTWLAERADLAR